ncbi:MAG: aromatic ring-hydroxylating dioxygenase subunit alpha [Proteobacteria bacterium]|nr:aromatic ring-hydroxylating dioxygenase subunit alpha [Pseudomonadota bacterium]
MTVTPPSFADARTRRQMARAAGLHPDHWYPVACSNRLRQGQVIETKFLDRPIAVFRGADGKVGAIENRCAHRQLKLSLGAVQGCTLVCAYHGWAYDTSGRCVSVAHDTFGKSIDRIRVGSFPVRERYGLIWIFPGAPARASQTPMPEIPELEAPAPWASVAADFVWSSHFSMIIENVSDFTHAHLHRKYRPFNDAKLISLETVGTQVRLTYDVLVGDGRISKHFVDRTRTRVDRMDLCFEYPYQWSNTGDRIKHWCFVLPMDARTTHAFFIFYFDAVQIPLLRRPMPRALQGILMRLAKRLLITPLLSQDGQMVQAEQQAFERYPDTAGHELNPAVPAFQQVIIDQWRRHAMPANVTHEPA